MSAKIYTQDQESTTSLLRQARTEAKLTQAEVAQLLGVTQSYVSKVESGQTRIDVISLKQFAKIYKKQVSWFLQ
jgi:transcriptional regulator with XRE-family HTH domain